MKLVGKHIERDGSGRVTVIPDEADDLWHIYNLIVAGDKVSATTFRKVQSESSTGSVDNQRLRVKLTLGVEALDIDQAASQLSIKGRNVEESKFVKLGAYHTIVLELNRPIKIFKDLWDSIALDRIRDASDVQKHANVGAIVCEEGLANICLLTDARTVLRQRIDVQIPKKRQGVLNSKHEKALERFYDQIYKAALLHFDFSIIKVVIIASPGFWRENVMEHFKKQAAKPENKSLNQQLEKFLLVHCAGGHVHNLTEAITKEPKLRNKLGDWKAMQEVKALERFQKLMANSPDRAAYGLKHVELARERGAVEVLMICDTLFRSEDVKTRRKYVQIVEEIQKMPGAQVLLFSAMHPTGQQLLMLTGIAAILKFGIPEIDDDSDVESS